MSSVPFGLINNLSDNLSVVDDKIEYIEYY